MLFSGTKVLQASGDGGSTPDGGCLAVVLRTGFGTAQGQLVRTMIFSSERVSANNMESFLFIGFLLIFAVAASWYVWVNGEQLTVEMAAMHFHRMLTLAFPGLAKGLKKGKLLLDCILIVTSVVPPELPMELSLAVNASLVALSKFGAQVYGLSGAKFMVDKPFSSHILHGAFQNPVCRTCGRMLL